MRGEGHFGRKLSSAEYDQAVVRLHESLPRKPSKEQARRVRRQELDCFIDYCFGVDFPAERRDELWRVRSKIDRRFPWLIVKYAFARILGKSLEADRSGLADFTCDAYSEVLSPSELRQFMYPEEGEKPTH